MTRSPPAAPRSAPDRERPHRIRPPRPSLPRAPRVNDAAADPGPPRAPHAGIAPRHGRIARAAGLFAALLIPGLAAAQSCQSIDGIPVTYNVDFSVLQGILDANCSGCHSSGSGSGNFLIRFDVVRQQLLGPPPENGQPASSTYPGFRRVVPGRPELSLFWLKLNCNIGPGGQMPIGGSLSLAEQALFHDWIRGGAIMRGDGITDPGTDRRFVDDFEAYR